MNPATWIVLIVILGLLLRLPQLNASLWLDEAAQAQESSRPLSQQLQIRDDFQPPLIHLVVFTLLQVSNNESWLRLGAALIPGLITLWGTIILGQKYFSKKTGIVAGLLLATSSFHIFYSQELRPYSLPAMFAVLSWWAILEMREKKLASVAQLVRFGLWSVLGLYSSYLYPFVLIGQFLYLMSIWRKNAVSIKYGMLTFLGIGLAFLPWVPSFLDQISAGQQLRQDFVGWEDVVSFDQVKSLTLIGGKFVFGVLDLSVNLPFLIVFGGIAAAIVFLVWKTGSLKNTSKLWLLSSWMIVPIITAWIISFWIPVVQPKRVLFALPAFYVLVGWMCEMAGKQQNYLKQLGYGVFGTLLALNIFSTVAYFTQTKYQRENWREVHDYISQKYNSANSTVLFGFPDEFASWHWYNSNNFPTAATGVFTVSGDPESPERQRLKQLTEYSYILVFDYLRDLTDPSRLIEADLQRYGYEQVDVIQGNEALGMIRVFARTRQIIGYSEY